MKKVNVLNDLQTVGAILPGSEVCLGDRCLRATSVTAYNDVSKGNWMMWLAALYLVVNLLRDVMKFIGVIKAVFMKLFLSEGEAKPSATTSTTRDQTTQTSHGAEHGRAQGNLLPCEVIVTTHGSKYHVNPHCTGLNAAAPRNVQRRGACNLCVNRA